MDTSAENKYRKSPFLKHEYTTPTGQEIPELRSAIFVREAAIDMVAEGSGFSSEMYKQEAGFYALAQEVRELKEQHGIKEPIYRLDTEI